MLKDCSMPNTYCYPCIRHMQMQKNVLFAGYKVPHPLDHSFVLKVQTDTQTTPTEALQKGVDGLIGSLSLLEERVKVYLRR